MRKIEITLPDELAEKLEAGVAKHNLEVNEFFSQIVGGKLTELLSLIPKGKKWMPQEKWDALVRGENCPLCSEISVDEKAKTSNGIIAELSMSYLRLSIDQSIAGYCVLISKKHVREIYQLSNEDQQLYFSDIIRVSMVLERLFTPAKMNYEILGNLVPHLHCHIKPRYYGDAAPGAPIYPGDNPLYLTDEEYNERARVIKEALNPLQPLQGSQQ